MRMNEITMLFQTIQQNCSNQQMVLMWLIGVYTLLATDVKTYMGKHQLSKPALKSCISNRHQLLFISTPPLSTSDLPFSSLFLAFSATCSTSSKSSTWSQRTASIQQQRRRTTVCAENRACPLSSRTQADCIHLSNWGWHLLCIQSQGSLYND